MRMAAQILRRPVTTMQSRKCEIEDLFEVVKTSLVHATSLTWIGVAVQVDGAESGVVILIIDGDRVQLVREGQKKTRAAREVMDRRKKELGGEPERGAQTSGG